MRKSNWSEGEVFIKAVKDLFSWQMRKLQLKARFKAAIVQCLEKKNVSNTCQETNIYKEIDLS